MNIKINLFEALLLEKNKYVYRDQHSKHIFIHNQECITGLFRLIRN